MLRQRLVKDFDADCEKGDYVVKVEVGEGLPPVMVYDNRTGSEREYYRISAKPIQKIRRNKDVYVLYV